MVMGSGDMLSSVVRQTLIMVTTPDGMRGRVSAINSLFYGTSGQFGSNGTVGFGATSDGVWLPTASGGDGSIHLKKGGGAL